MALHLHSAALHLLSNNDCAALLHVAGHYLIAAHVLIVGAALRFVRIGALSLVLGLSNWKVTKLATLPVFLTAFFLPPVILVLIIPVTKGNLNKETKKQLEKGRKSVHKDNYITYT